MYAECWVKLSNSRSLVYVVLPDTAGSPMHKWVFKHCPGVPFTKLDWRGSSPMMRMTILYDIHIMLFCCLALLALCTNECLSSVCTIVHLGMFFVGLEWADISVCYLKHKYSPGVFVLHALGLSDHCSALRVSKLPLFTLFTFKCLSTLATIQLSLTLRTFPVLSFAN